MKIEEMENSLIDNGISRSDMEVVCEDAKPTIRINGDRFDANMDMDSLRNTRDCQIATFAFIAGWKLALRHARDLVSELSEGAEPEFLEDVLESTGIHESIRKELGF